MTTTWDIRLAGDRHNLKLFFTVSGVPQVFSEGYVANDALFNGRTEYKVMTAHPQVSMMELDLIRRRPTGGTMKLSLQDTDAHVLRALVRPRVRATTWLTSNDPAAITVNSTAGLGGFPVSGDMWIGQECIGYTTASATTFSAIVRAKYGSIQQRHYGELALGAPVYSSIPSWKGRRLNLYGVFVEQSHGATAAILNTSMWAPLGVWEINDVPTYEDDDQWSIDCIPLHQSIAKRKAYVGLRDCTPADGLIFMEQANNRIVVQASFQDVFQFRLSPSWNNYVLLSTSNGDKLVMQLIGVGTVLGTLTIDHAGHVPASAVRAFNRVVEDAVGVQATTIRQIGMIGGGAGISGRALTYVLVSDEGTGGSGVRDILPGRHRSEYSAEEWRIGAAIPLADIDYASFDALGVSAWWTILDKPTDVADILETWCRANDALWTISSSGLVTAKAYSQERVSSAMTIDDSMLDGPVRVTYDESSIYPVVTLRCHYNPMAADFDAEINIIDAELLDRYGSQAVNRLEIEDKSTFLAGVDFSQLSKSTPFIAECVRSVGDLQVWVRRLQRGSDGRGRVMVECSAHLPALALVIGDIVTLTAAECPDLDGGTLDGVKCRVMGHKPLFDTERVELKLLVLDTLLHVAPAATITANNLASLRLTLSGVDFFGPGSIGEVIDNFDGFFLVTIYDKSNPAQTHVADITSVDRVNGYIFLSSFPAWAISNNNDWLTLSSASQSEGYGNANGYAGTDYTFFANLANGYALTSGLIQRWR